MNNDLFFSSKSDEYATPEDLYNKLNMKYKFTLDPCSTDDNHKCKKYYTIKEDGLSQSWKNEIVFCNPPYSKIKLWVKKCFEEATQNKTTIVLLIPVRTDTQYFHNYIYNKCEIIFIKGRLKFGNCKNAAPFPSMLCIYNGDGQYRIKKLKGDKK